MFSHFSFVLKNRKNNLTGKFEDGQLSVLWKESIKDIYPQASIYTTYNQIINNILFIKVSDPLWVGELETKKEFLIKKINTHRVRKIQNIRFTI